MLGSLACVGQTPTVKAVWDKWKRRHGKGLHSEQITVVCKAHVKPIGLQSCLSCLSIGSTLVEKRLILALEPLGSVLGAVDLRAGGYTPWRPLESHPGLRQRAETRVCGPPSLTSQVPPSVGPSLSPGPSAGLFFPPSEAEIVDGTPLEGNRRRLGCNRQDSILSG